MTLNKIKQKDCAKDFLFFKSSTPLIFVIPGIILSKAEKRKWIDFVEHVGQCQSCRDKIKAHHNLKVAFEIISQLKNEGGQQ